jgi:signal transduction protein with GAF and PtsI domain
MATVKVAHEPKKYLVPRRYYTSLYKITKSMTSSLRIHDVMNAIVTNTAAATDAKACSITLLCPDRKRVWYGSSYGLSESYKHKGTIFNRGGIGKCCSERRPILATQPDNDQLIQYPEAAKAEGIASFLFVPLILRDEAVGVLTVYTSDPRAFPDEVVGFLEAIANLSAQALANARVYEWAMKHEIDLAGDLLEWCTCWESKSRDK